MRLGRRSPDEREATPRATYSRRSVDRLKLVLDVSRLLSVPDLPTLLDSIAGAARELLAAEEAHVFLETGPDEPWAPPVDDLDVPGGLCAPMRDLDRRVIGVVEVRHKVDGEFGPEDHVMLELLAEHAALAVQRYRLLREAALGAELRREMELARRVQSALLPRTVPRLRTLPAVGWTRTASITGGDCYDLWLLPDGRLGVFVGDASGHGLAAALVISQARSMLRALAEVRAEPEWLLAQMNGRLAQDLDEGRFVTAFVGLLSASGELRWASAGQGPIFVRPSADEPWHAFQPNAVPLGVMADLDVDAASAVRFGAGGGLVATTDGILESRNESGELFGPARLLTLLEACGDGNPEQVIALVRDAVTAWRGREQPDDDETIVAARYLPR